MNPQASTSALPGKVRSAKSKADLVQAGGRRLTVNLSPQAAADLAALRAAGGHKTDRLAIEAALRAAAGQAPPAARKIALAWRAS